eukprot:3941907-Rhodomonas_salina.2
MEEWWRRTDGEHWLRAMEGDGEWWRVMEEMKGDGGRLGNDRGVMESGGEWLRVKESVEVGWRVIESEWTIVMESDGE